MMTNAEIRVGEYVRTEQGYIAKLERIDEDKMYWFDDTIYYGYEAQPLIWESELEEVIKHSFNIIDLIEVEDIVEIAILGEDTEFGVTDPIGAIWHIKDESMLRNIKKGCKLGTFELESILTHEQFADMKYKVVEEDD